MMRSLFAQLSRESFVYGLSAALAKLAELTDGFGNRISGVVTSPRLTMSCARRTGTSGSGCRCTRGSGCAFAGHVPPSPTRYRATAGV